MQVTAITHKRAPVFASIISQVTPSESSVIKKVAYEPLFLAHLRDTLSIKGVRRVVMHEPLTNLRPVIFVQIRPRHAAHRSLARAARRGELAGRHCGKIVIAVSEDIDPDNPDAVFWSLAYRSNPIEDVQIAPYRADGHGPNPGPRSEDSTMLIDATLKDTTCRRWRCPSANSWSARATIWEELGLPALTPQPPWHGYSLGDWDTRVGHLCAAAPSPANGRRPARKPSRAAAAG